MNFNISNENVVFAAAGAAAVLAVGGLYKLGAYGAKRFQARKAKKAEANDSITEHEGIMKHVIIENTSLGRTLCLDIKLMNKYPQFFRGWTSAAQPITPEETYVLADELNLGIGLTKEIGILYGRVRSYKGLIYLNSVIPLPEEVFKGICHGYE